MLKKQLLILLLIAGIHSFSASFVPAPAKPGVFEIRTFLFKDSAQERMIDTYLQEALIPALHRTGIHKAGVFKMIGNDTAAVKKIYVLLPFRSLEQWNGLTAKLARDETYQQAGTAYRDASYKEPAYLRMESVLLNPFPLAPGLLLPELHSPMNERVYELRSYESASEKQHLNKVKMFNEGGEVALFKRLGFNAVFYGSVMSGSHMPNLMYMTSFENKVERDAHWKTFSADAEWKKLSAMQEYQNNVSHIDIVFLRPAGYSDF